MVAIWQPKSGSIVTFLPVYVWKLGSLSSTYSARKRAALSTEAQGAALANSKRSIVQATPTREHRSGGGGGLPNRVTRPILRCTGAFNRDYKLSRPEIETSA